MALAKFAGTRRRLAAGLTMQQPAWRNPDPKARYDAVIIGGGGHGLAAAFYLAKIHRLRHTAVLVRGWIGETGWQLPVVYGRGPDLKDTVGLHHMATTHYAGLAGELGFDPGTGTRGVLDIVEDGVGAKTQRYAAELYRLAGGAATKLNHEATLAKAGLLKSPDASELRRFDAVHYPDGGIADPERLIWAYARAADALGVDVVQNCDVNSFVVEGGKVAGLDTSRGEIATPVVAIAAESHAADMAALAGFMLPLRARTINAIATEPFSPILDPVLVSRLAGITACQMPDGRIVAWAPPGDYASNSPWGSGRQTERLLSEAARLVPGLGGASATRRWTAPIDLTPDGQPIIGRAPLDGVFLNCGWGAEGYAALPASGISFAELLGRASINDVIAPFAPGRFAAGASLHPAMTPTALTATGAPCF